MGNLNSKLNVGLCLVRVWETGCECSWREDFILHAQEKAGAFSVTLLFLIWEEILLPSQVLSKEIRQNLLPCFICLDYHESRQNLCVWRFWRKRRKKICPCPLSSSCSISGAGLTAKGLQVQSPELNVAWYIWTGFLLLWCMQPDTSEVSGSFDGQPLWVITVSTESKSRSCTHN